MSDDPKVKAVDLHNQGAALLADPAPDQEKKHLAYRFFSSAVDVDPTLAEAWYALGNMNGDLNLLPAAVACWRKGLEHAPHDGKMWSNLGHRLYGLGRLDEARAATLRAIDTDLESGYPWCNLALIECVEGDHEKAVEAARMAFAMTPDATTEMGLAFTLMFSGRWAEGLRHFEARFPYKLKQFLEYPYPQWHGEDISNEVLFLMSEQGLGDTLSFARFVPAVAARAKTVLLHVQGEAFRLFSLMFADLPNVELIPLPAPFRAADRWTTMTSLPVALGLSDAEIEASRLPVPFLPPAPAGWKREGARLHVGIAWQGARANDVDKWRSFPVETLFPLAGIEGVQVYSLQVGEDAAALHKAGAAGFIRDLSPYLRDVVDTLAVMQELDVVVTCESAVRHMAGLLGKRCLVPYSYNGGDWRCGRTRPSPLWDPTTELFRQGPDARWDGPVARIVERLKEMRDAGPAA